MAIEHTYEDSALGFGHNGRYFVVEQGTRVGGDTNSSISAIHVIDYSTAADNDTLLHSKASLWHKLDLPGCFLIDFAGPDNTFTCSGSDSIYVFKVVDSATPGHPPDIIQLHHISVSTAPPTISPLCCFPVISRSCHIDGSAPSFSTVLLSHDQYQPPLVLKATGEESEVLAETPLHPHWRRKISNGINWSITCLSSTYEGINGSTFELVQHQWDYVTPRLKTNRALLPALPQTETSL